MSTPTAYPLQWPQGWPTTKPVERVKHPSFKCDVPQALRQLKREVELLGGQNLILSSNYTLGNERPKEPGVVAYFKFDGAEVAIPCDRWIIIEHNIRAIALTIEAMRGMERWGAKHMIKAMFTGFKQLPQQTGGQRPWWVVLQLQRIPEAKDQHVQNMLAKTYRILATERHPDKGGSHEAMTELNRAYSEANQWLNQ